jgi:tetratricopeptide (TPR) repeat protein
VAFLARALLVGVAVALIPSFGMADQPTLSDAMQKLEAVADAYPPRVAQTDRKEIENLWRWVEGGMLEYRKSRPAPDENAEFMLGEIYRLGNNLDISGSSEKAISHFRAAIAINPANPKTHRQLGHHLTFVNEPAAGAQELLLGIALDPRGADDRSIYDLAYNFYFQKQFALAKSFADRYLHVNASDVAMKTISEQSAKVLAGGEPPKTITIRKP